jgi:hypothetical protein
MHLLLEEERCPVSDALLGALYHAGTGALDELILSIPSAVRARLALYCYRRSHLQTVGITIAASCGELDLLSSGGNAGAALYGLAHRSPVERVLSHYQGRKKISLSKGKVTPPAADGWLPPVQSPL